MIWLVDKALPQSTACLRSLVQMLLWVYRENRTRLRDPGVVETDPLEIWIRPYRKSESWSDWRKKKPNSGYNKINSTTIFLMKWNINPDPTTLVPDPTTHVPDPTQPNPDAEPWILRARISIYSTATPIIPWWHNNNLGHKKFVYGYQLYWSYFQIIFLGAPLWMSLFGRQLAGQSERAEYFVCFEKYVKY